MREAARAWLGRARRTDQEIESGLCWHDVSFVVIARASPYDTGSASRGEEN
jgi:hypothetical protein